MVYLTKDTQNRQDDKSIFFFTNIWVKSVSHISDRVFVAPEDIGGTLLIDMQLFYFRICFRGTNRLN